MQQNKGRLVSESSAEISCPADAQVDVELGQHMQMQELTLPSDTAVMEDASLHD